MPVNVVIVGAGASARVLTKTLKRSDVHITIVQPNKFATLPYFQTLILTQRDTLVENSTFNPIRGSDQTVFGVAVACSDGVLAVKPLDPENGPLVELPFDILVAATGSKFPVMVETPGQSQTERQQEIDHVSKALLSGKHVVIAGGGATGVELAGDLLESLPANRRNVTLICSGDRLLPDQAEKYGEKAEMELKRLGCDIVYGDRVISHDDTTISHGEPIQLELKSGKKLSCGSYFAAFARGANTSWLTTPHGDKGGLPSQLVDDRGRVVVNQYLQSPVYDKLYALAATNNRSEPAIFMNVESQARTVAANIKAPNSRKVPEGVKHAIYQWVGHDTFAMIVPENLPLPGILSRVALEWCGYPVNLLVPGWCCAVTCGPVDPMTCGYCCDEPAGRGLTKTLDFSKRMGIMATSLNYGTLGVGAPEEQSILR